MQNSSKYTLKEWGVRYELSLLKGGPEVGDGDRKKTGYENR